MNSDNAQPIKSKKVTKPKYTDRVHYYSDESGDYDSPYAYCDVCDRSVSKRTLVDGLCEMCDEKSELKKKHFNKKNNKQT